MIEIKRIQKQPDLAQAIYAVMADVYPVSPWTLEQIQEQLPQTSYQETLPNAANLALWAWDKEADSLHDFVPNYLKRVEAEENWLKNHTESGESYIKRL